MFEYDQEDRTFVQRHPGLTLVAVLAGISLVFWLAAFAVHALSGSHSAARKDDMMIVSLPPPPPPPPKLQPTPPPQQAPTPEQQLDPKMLVQPPDATAKKPDAPKDKPDAPAPLGTSITGPGGGADLGLVGGLGGLGGNGNGGDGGGGSKYGWYASEVQTRITDALRNNPNTRRASMNLVVRIWPDSSGRITKARLSGSTGDPALDATIRDNILTGMQLSDPPPSDMPLPIVMRVSAQRPQ
jgi:hypothetical protein